MYQLSIFYILFQTNQIYQHFHGCIETIYGTSLDTVCWNLLLILPGLQPDIIIIIQLMQIHDIDDELLFSIVIFQNHPDNYDLLSSKCFIQFKKLISVSIRLLSCYVWHGHANIPQCYGVVWTRLTCVTMSISGRTAALWPLCTDTDTETLLQHCNISSSGHWLSVGSPKLSSGQILTETMLIRRWSVWSPSACAVDLYWDIVVLRLTEISSWLPVTVT